MESNIFSKKYRIGIVGLVFGRHVLNWLQQGGNKQRFLVRSICDTNASVLKKVEMETGITAYPSMDLMLNDPDIDVIGLFTGPHQRAELIRKCIRAGKDVITTKPFETDEVAAKEVLDEAVALGRKIFSNSPGPVPAPDIAVIENWHSEFKLGKPVAARGETWVSYREKYAGTWYDDPLQCPCAPILRLGIYLINDLVHLLGEIDEVHTVQSRIFTERPTSDNAQIGLRFQGGAIGNVFSSFCINDGNRYSDSLIVNYENGTIYRNWGPMEPSGKATLKLVIPENNTQKIAAETSVSLRSGEFQWQAIYNALSADTADLSNSYRILIEGSRILQMLLQHQRSLQTLPL